MQLTVTNSPFNEEQTEKINQILPTLTPEQKIWFSGYLTANQQSEAKIGIDAPSREVAEYLLNTEIPSKTREITILYGSETGNAQSIAETLEGRLKENEFTVKLSSMENFKPKDLKKVQDLFIISATHGEGEPPDNAATFHEFIHGRKAPKLSDLRYSVLALGDQSYEFFCQTGKDFDERLEALGGERLSPRVDCDLDFDEPAEKWMEGILSSLADSAASVSTSAADTESAQSSNTQKYSRTNPYRAEVLENINLNGRGSNKEVRHIELSLEDFGESFEPGDCLGVFPENDARIVDQLLETFGWNPETDVEINADGETLPLAEALTSRFEITKLTKPLLIKAAEIFGNTALKEVVNEEGWIQSYIEGRDLIDLIGDFPAADLHPETLLQILRKLPAREYSIASSYKANPDEVHLTVGAVRYNAHDRDRSGVCSVQFAERIEPGDTVPVYVKKNPNFKFPFNEETPVIMIGPGTGVAPFRAYMEEREELELEGKTWLFFGEQHFTTDFLYQTEWQSWLKDGVLSRLDLAFSRDTDEKIYVQHRIEQNSKEFYQWLNEGAALYVCGDEKSMAKDVHYAIRTVLEKEGGLSEEDAESYLLQLKKDKRYQRDVY
ncbi:assimilatory sulfite reductase (NADPH) flavoprotein subunit [Salinicoccus halodurans]|uniref:assimilatory sulfite reductase (NADPH) n=1 Tax=Salinicoccus halodurans TaxID=407035 RepID=A0A0F7HID0_9STAP|nr:assimilatory sulfite reductase (NADPH) flavoprotein subunit [Salinicoccus halodurans]AKG72799.1 sulfite reductase [NADPH] flavoprotein alpha-component [Salinicoccus halodurans]SFK74291.1 sulfite reductase (NADPH) alpha subunit [Salinicoccus halodurans]